MIFFGGNSNGLLFKFKPDKWPNAPKKHVDSNNIKKNKRKKYTERDY